METMEKALVAGLVGVALVDTMRAEHRGEFAVTHVEMPWALVV